MSGTNGRHEMALPLAPEHRHRGGNAVQHAPRVDVDHGRPAVDVAVGQRAQLADPGIAHQHVEPAEPVDRRMRQPLEFRPATDVDHNHHHFGAVGA
jgi:hypothetical protein